MTTKDMTDKQVEEALKVPATVTVERTLSGTERARVTLYRESDGGPLVAAVDLRPDAVTFPAEDAFEGAEKVFARCVVEARTRLGAK